MATLNDESRPEPRRQIPPGEPLFTTKEAANYLRCSPPTLERWRTQGTGPVYRRRGPGKRSGILYRKSDLDAWLDDNAHRSTGEYRKPKPRR